MQIRARCEVLARPSTIQAGMGSNLLPDEDVEQCRPLSNIFEPPSIAQFGAPAIDRLSGSRGQLWNDTIVSRAVVGFDDHPEAQGDKTRG
jgi:hypothetical protein